MRSGRAGTQTGWMEGEGWGARGIFIRQGVPTPICPEPELDIHPGTAFAFIRSNVNP